VTRAFRLAGRQLRADPATDPRFMTGQVRVTNAVTGRYEQRYRLAL
jgi:hypothetical protein